MNCREFLDELDQRAEFSDKARLHLKKCVDCGNLERRNSHIWQMIESLPSVDAPADFNFRVRSRLASSRASDFRPAWWRSLRFVAPAFAAVLVLTLVLASQNFFITTAPQDLEQLAVIEKTDEEPNLIAPDTQAKSVEVNIAAPNTNYVDADFDTSSNAANANVLTEKTPLPVIAGDQKTVKSDNAPENEDAGGSRVFGLDKAPSPLLPEGLRGESANQTLPEDLVRSNGSQNVRSSLSVLGVETASENGGLRVVSVALGSIADRSGVKTGDLIQAIDGKNPLTNSFTSISNLTVQRGMQKLTLRIGVR